MGIAIVLIVCVGLAVIVGLALLRYPKSQWNERVRGASHMVINGIALPRLDEGITVREVTLSEMWAENSKVGNAYGEISSPEEPVADSAGTSPVRASIADRLPKITALAHWQDSEADSDSSERTVA